VLLFQKRFHEGLKSGDVTLTFRRWDKPRVKVGGRYRCHPIGVLEVHGIARINVASIDAADALRAGFPSIAELIAYIASATGAPIVGESEVFRVELSHGGDGDRVPIALDDSLSDLADLEKRLDRLDGNSPWTRQILRLIARHPRVAASKLAKKVKRETEPFKVDVRKLKKLGLTQSFEVGYEISPRGKKLMATKKKAPTKKKLDPVTEYIAAQTAPIAKALTKVRAIIRKAAPDAVEGTSYKIASYKLDGRVLIYFAGFKAHYSMYPATKGIQAALGDDFETHKKGAGTLRFDGEDAVPVKLIERAVKARVKEVRALHSVRSR